MVENEFSKWEYLSGNGGGIDENQNIYQRTNVKFRELLEIIPPEDFSPYDDEKVYDVRHGIYDNVSEKRAEKMFDDGEYVECEEMTIVEIIDEYFKDEVIIQCAPYDKKMHWFLKHDDQASNIGTPNDVYSQIAKRWNLGK